MCMPGNNWGNLRNFVPSDINDVANMTDRNGTGKISNREFRQFWNTLNEFSIGDRNNDGHVSYEEAKLAQFSKNAGSEKAEKFASADKNGDNKISGYKEINALRRKLNLPFNLWGFQMARESARQMNSEFQQQTNISEYQRPRSW